MPNILIIQTLYKSLYPFNQDPVHSINKALNKLCSNLLSGKIRQQDLNPTIIYFDKVFPAPKLKHKIFQQKKYQNI